MENVKEKNPNQPLTLNELAEFLRCDRETAVKMIKSGKLKAARVGAMYRISRKAIERFLEGESAQIEN